MKLRTFLGLIACILIGTAVAADKPADVRDLMSATQFHTTGLDRLTPEEMAAFNAWLASYTHAVAADTGGTAAAAPAVPAMTAPLPSAPVTAPSAASRTANFGQEMLSSTKRDEPVRIESTIPGHFTGWTGNTTFKLANGQVWQQTDSSAYDANLQDPQVVIKRLGFGYLLTLTGHGATVFVKRVQ